eukprot:5367389-Alexandrium_andersonii.AAC.1
MGRASWVIKIVPRPYDYLIGNLPRMGNCGRPANWQTRTVTCAGANGRLRNQTAERAKRENDCK